MDRISEFLKNKRKEWAILSVLLVPVLGADIWCAGQSVQLTAQQRQVKEDFARVNSIRQGLFSLEVWKHHFRNIVGDSITHLQLSPQEEATIKAEIEKIVKRLILEADGMMRKGKKTFRGKVRKVAYSALVDVPALTRQSPRFAEAVLNEITTPASLEKLKTLALSQLESYAQQTHDNTDQEDSPQKVFDKYHVPDTQAFNIESGRAISLLQEKIRWRIDILLASVGLFLAAWWMVRGKKDLHPPLFALSVALALIVLITSLSLPMIDIDARIKNVDFLLMGEHVQFRDQILFYRSKSILQVVHVLLMSKKGDSLLVGFLLLLFSIIFPIAKLIATLVCLFAHEKLRTRPWITFFAYRSGKWSMADVMVVAIFMSYIGFNSILNDQLKGLNVLGESWQLIATNETSLQPGFILFVSFVLFGLALSEILKRIVTEEFEEQKHWPTSTLPPHIEIQA